MNNLALFFTFALLVCFSHALEFDHCVADTSLPRGPEGYSCMDPANVTTDDFVFSGFRGERTTDNIFGFNATLAIHDTFPGLNGQSISIVRLDIGVGGTVPLHTHRTSEVIVIIRGSLIAGFIDTDNNAYYRTLEVGDVMIFPQGMLHFQYNNGTVPVLAYVALNAANPGFQFTTLSLFAGNLPADLAQHVTLLSQEEVTRIRRMFGNA